MCRNIRVLYNFEPPTTKEEIDAFVDSMLAACWEYFAATVYAIDEEDDADPNHELVVGVDRVSGLGALRYAGDDGDWFSQVSTPTRTAWSSPTSVQPVSSPATQSCRWAWCAKRW